MRRSAIHIGCSGWMYRHWHGDFYPRDMPVKHWFGHYAAHFDTVEINNSFYRLPKAETFDTWAAQAPTGFCYAVKANRFITQAKKLKDCEEPLARMMAPVRHLGDRLGPILFQLPPRFRINLERLDQFLTLLPGDVTPVFEFRDESWNSRDVVAVLGRHGAGFCAHDMPGLATPRWATGRAAYVRFHGAGGKYRGRYAAEALRGWAEWMVAQAEEREVWAYFNNDIGGAAPRDALALKAIVDELRAAHS